MTPPNDLDAERAVLSACFADVNSYEQAAGTILPESFFWHPHRVIWEAIGAVVAANEEPDVVTVAGWLREHGKIKAANGIRYIGEIIDAVPSVSNVPAYIKTVSNLYKLRKLIEATHKIAAQGYSVASCDVEEYADQSQAIVWDIVSSGMARDRLTNVKDQTAETFKHIRAIAENDRDALGAANTGFKGLDRLLCGWFPGDLSILAARPAMGKTGLALQLAMFQAKAGACSLLFSLEMSTLQLMSRLLAQDARVDLNRMRRGDVQEMDWRKITGGAARLEEVGEGMWIDDTSGSTVLDISAKSRRVQAMAKKKGRDLKLIVVDYLQLLRPADKEGTREQQVAAMSRSLKRIARDLGVTVLALSQLSRAVESRQDKRPVLSDLRESGAIEQDADNVMFLYRPGYYEKDNENREADLILAKQRNGPTGDVCLEFFSGCASFEDRSF